ncbi:pseudouridine synthase [Mucilaginibacter frigoritolerans]|nr:pseudouridine synthase [Mucilaginibacter frigoritolerans]
MAFNRPGNGKGDQSGRSSNRASKAGDRPKRSSGTDRTENNSSKRYSSDRPAQAGGSKPYQKREGGDKPASSFSSSGSDRRSPRSKPYSGRPADAGDDRPKRSFGGGESSGDRKSFSPRSKPYSGRVADSGDDRPKRSFGGGESSGDRKSFSPRSKPYGSRPADSGDDRPKRSFSGGAPSGDKKPFSSRGKSTGSFNADDKPKRSFASDRPGDKKFAGKPSAGGFKKPYGDKPADSDRPQRSRTKYDKITPDLDAPVKTLRGRKKAAEPKAKDTGLIRLNRYISNAGICSRRKADELIIAGVVSVNGVVISELGHKVDPQKDEIRYNGETLKREKMVYVLLNKPKDYITTTEDPQERRTVMHLVEKASRERIYPIGRLDRNTTGLLLMTNDGDLADKLSHPRNNIVKLYQVELNKSLTQGDLNKISFGLELEDGLIKPDSISYVAGGSKREIGIQIHSGKNRIVRRIFEHLGYEVVKLDRAVYANLTKKDLPRGRWRFLEESEVVQLKHLI